MKSFLIAIFLSLSVLLSGCTRITDGEVGVRVSATGQIRDTELTTGYHQTMIGDILQFPVRDLTLPIENFLTLTSENTALGDFDFNIIYNINPAAVAELYRTKARTFHYKDEKTGDIFLMSNYLKIVAQNAAGKAIRQYKSLEAADNRKAIEEQIKANIAEQLKSEKLENSVIISAIQIKDIKPNAQILQSSTELVKSQNDLKIADNQIQLAKKEAERQAALAQNSQQSIAYMDAQARVMIAEAVRNGKVQTIIIPSNMTSLMLGK